MFHVHRILEKGGGGMNINIRAERYNGQRRYSHYGSYIITNQKVLATGYIGEKD